MYFIAFILFLILILGLCFFESFFNRFKSLKRLFLPKIDKALIKREKKYYIELEKNGYSNIINLKESLFLKFMKLENALNECDLETIEKICGNELYNEYNTLLEVAKLKNERKMRIDFVKNSFYISNVFIDKDDIKIELELSINYKEYIKNNDISDTEIDKIEPNTYLFRLVYSKKIDGISTCPNCGSKTKNLSKCEYCGTVFPNNNEDDFSIIKCIKL